MKDSKVYKCCLCHKVIEEKDCSSDYICAMCKKCARSLDYYGSN